MAAIPAEFRAAFLEHERDLTIRKTRLGCLLGALFVPLFSPLDYYIYPKQTHAFFVARLVCSILMMAFYPVIGAGYGRKNFRLLGVVILFFPAATIAWMVYDTKGMASPYYAGLILVMMFLAVLLDWSFWQSVASVTLVWALYLLACFYSPAPADLHGPGGLINNLFFLLSTGIVIIVSTKFHSDIRVREFVFRCELDKSRKALEASLAQLKENEAQLVHSEKLASLGRMSAGMIHEINNPLNYAKAGLDVLRDKKKHLAPEQQADFADILKDVEDGVNRVKTIVSDLRMFTHPDTEERDVVAMGEVVNTALRFLNNECREKVEFKLELPPDLVIWANKNKLIHVLTNLLQNSLDALKRKTFTDEKPAIRITGRMAGGVTFLTVRDNGPGIAAGNLDKIYDPFFTTKDVGEGMGLGLSICYRIVREAKGKISVKTEPGKFCEFTLEFPASENIPAPN